MTPGSYSGSYLDSSAQDEFHSPDAPKSGVLHSPISLTSHRNHLEAPPSMSWTGHRDTKAMAERQIVFATPAGAILPLISSRVPGTDAVLLSPEEVASSRERETHEAALQHLTLSSHSIGRSPGKRAFTLPDPCRIHFLEASHARKHPSWNHISNVEAGGFIITAGGITQTPPAFSGRGWKSLGALAKLGADLYLSKRLVKDPLTHSEVWAACDEQVGSSVPDAADKFPSWHDSTNKGAGPATDLKGTLPEHLRFLLQDWGVPRHPDAPPRMLDAFACPSATVLLLETALLGSLEALTDPEALGAIPEPLLSLMMRLLLNVLDAVHAKGLSLGNRLGPGSVWLAADGSLKISILMHLESASREDLKRFAVSSDLHYSLDLCDKLGNAKKMKMVRPRHELDYELKMMKDKLEAKKAEKGKLDVPKNSAQASNQEEIKKLMKDESKMAALNSQITQLQIKVEQARIHLRDMDEMIHLFPLTLSSARKGRCRSFVDSGAVTQGGKVFLTTEGLRKHAFVTAYSSIPADALLRWVQVGGSNGGGNKLARSIYEMDPEIEEEIAEFLEISSKPDRLESKKGSSVHMQEMLKFFNTYARSTVGSAVGSRHIDLDCLRRLLRDMFPSDGFTDEQIQEGFMLIDTEGVGKISFDVFSEWWTNMKVSDTLGLQMEWLKALQSEELQEVQFLQTRASAWHRKNTWRRWKERMNFLLHLRHMGKHLLARADHFAKK
eukprot:CAMPEP_0180126144 /NCGR_PEP_ID=MMETSP0986-20121125/5549_1 /TAXON_ID=697907 /ORGANISM="non described non described, Strain CCMP2293" /LENGTH=724 /DNA_ID=CAMNT_0022065573 /DNA_START=44 /DNA_END=2216 /DNA_ORIENTATION=-